MNAPAADGRRAEIILQQVRACDRLGEDVSGAVRRVRTGLNLLDTVDDDHHEDVLAVVCCTSKQRSSLLQASCRTMGTERSGFVSASPQLTSAQDVAIGKCNRSSC